MSAREQGARVLLVEGAPRAYRGGNSRHTRNLRCMHDAPTEVLTDAYGQAEYWDDLIRVTGGETDEGLARLVIEESAACTAWMHARGVRFQPPLGGTLHLGRTNAFFLGGGKALVNAYYRTAERLGVDIVYDSDVTDLEFEGRHFVAALVEHEGRQRRIEAKALVAAAGGFEANIPWLKQSWGEVAENFLIRGTPYNQGRVLRALLDRGAKQVGDPKQCHAVAIDGRAPKFDGGIVTRARLRLPRHRGQPGRPAFLR